jgi:uncharacterized protein YnzC (UPF0291/DUF896 family)
LLSQKKHNRYAHLSAAWQVKSKLTQEEIKEERKTDHELFLQTIKKEMKATLERMLGNIWCF